MSRDKESAKTRLDEELSELRFTEQADVLKRAFPKTRSERLRALWNKEIELPVVPGVTAALLLFVFLGIQRIPGSEPDPAVPPARQLVETGGNTYWKDELEKAVTHAENQNKS